MPNIDFDIDRVAKLSYLELSEEERAELAEQLPAIVAYITKLHEVDTSNVETRVYLTDQTNAFREDESSMDDAEKKAIIDNFPQEKGGALEVPAIFE